MDEREIAIVLAALEFWQSQPNAIAWVRDITPPTSDEINRICERLEAAKTQWACAACGSRMWVSE